jgi:hypothetical protein
MTAAAGQHSPNVKWESGHRKLRAARVPMTLSS